MNFDKYENTSTNNHMNPSYAYSGVNKPNIADVQAYKVVSL